VIITFLAKKNIFMWTQMIRCISPLHMIPILAFFIAPNSKTLTILAMEAICGLRPVASTYWYVCKKKKKKACYHSEMTVNNDCECDNNAVFSMGVFDGTSDALNENSAMDMTTTNWGYNNTNMSSGYDVASNNYYYTENLYTLPKLSDVYGSSSLGNKYFMTFIMVWEPSYVYFSTWIGATNSAVEKNNVVFFKKINVNMCNILLMGRFQM
ncbi:hypothetical protein RFI_15600, partial [Reticulomyxa filosa]